MRKKWGMGWTVKDYSSLFGAKEKNIYDVRVRLKVFFVIWVEKNYANKMEWTQPKNKKLTIILQYVQISMSYNLN